VLAGIGFAPPGRPLISTVTGQLITGADDLAALLTAQLSRPVLFAQAMTAAADHADLIVVAGTDVRLTELAAQASGRPAVALPGQLTPPATAVAALFAAGAIRDLMPFLQQRPQSRSEAAAAPLAVPAMRDGEARLPSQAH
jgi:enediyne polyketide synthase